MKILIDERITKRFSPAAADLDNSTDRRYLVASDASRLAVIVVREEVAEAIDHDVEAMTGLTVDCSSGTHDHGTLGYCQPENEGLLHSKLTMRYIVAEPHDMTLAEWYAQAIERDEAAHRRYTTGEQMALTLPPQLVTALRQIAAREKLNLNTLANDVLLNFAQRNQ
ncbi:MAG: hypothetical protein E6Q97_21005 [Desulfurellales bacterium]|nr:MAG: hypothetical protein E6Q97_21005 [Desulfurellales bacterium]